MNDPLDTPPKDHGSDRYGYVELQGAPEGAEPTQIWIDLQIARACLDCNPNLFLKWVGPPEASDDVRWEVSIAHDEGCPTYKKLEES